MSDTQKPQDAKDENELDGMVTVTTTPSKKFTCEIDVPTILTAAQMAAWSEDDSTKGLAGMAYIAANAKKCLPIFNSVIVNGVPLTQANFDAEIEKPTFPARVIYIISDAADAPLRAAMNQKK